MSANIYSEDIQSALDMIADYGQSVKWRILRADSEPPTPSDPWNPQPPASGDYTEYDVKIVFIPLKSKELQSYSYIAGTEILKGSEKALMGYTDNFTPSAKDVIIRNGQQYSIAYMTELNPNGQAPILWTMVVNK